MLLLSMPAGGEWIWVSGLFLFFFLIGVIPYIFYLLTLQDALRKVPEAQRALSPGQVWLMFIPVFNIVWQFIVVSRVADSLEAAFRNSGLPLSERPGYNVGIAYCICFCCSWIPLLGSLASIAGLVLWIIHWIKISEYRKRLAANALQPAADSSIFNG